MYNPDELYSCPYFRSTPDYSSDMMYNPWGAYPCPYCSNTPMYDWDVDNQYSSFTDEMDNYSRSDCFESEEDARIIRLEDYGPQPYVVNIAEATKENNAFRTALWTGNHLQLTLMSIKPGGDIGLEIHPKVDQFLRVEEGQGLVKMGNRKDNLSFQRKIYDDFAIFIPAGTWHNIINTGNKPLKLYSIYAPPQHPHGTVHKTKAAAEATEK